MQTKYDFRRKIMKEIKKGHEFSFSDLVLKMKINCYQERSNFLEALQELEKEEKVYYNSKSKYKAFPKHKLQIDRVISVPEGLILEKSNVLLNNNITDGKTYLDKDLVVTTKNIDDIYITKLVDRDIRSFKPYLLTLLQEKKLSYKKIRKLAHIKSARRKNELDNLLEELKENGFIYQENNFYKSWPNNLSLAKLDVDSNGYLFFELNGKRIYPDKDELNGAIQDDIIAITNRGKHIQKIINRKHPRAVFEVIEKDGVKSLAPVLINGEEDLKARISSIDMKNLAIGDRILVNLTNEKTDGVFEADYISTIGRIDDPKIDIISLADNYGFETEFSDEVMQEAYALPQEVSEEEIKERYDFSKRFKTFTIDCDHTKDMDDAVSIIKNEDGNYILAIHIADVAHYVKRNSKLDQAAYERGLSAYPVNTVIPQLPHIISNGICSLNPNVKRLTKTCIIEISQDGKILDYNFCDSVIESQKKMKYSEVNQILDENQIPEGYDNFIEDLTTMKELSDILDKVRTNEGKLTFIEEEFQFSEDENGQVMSIDKKSNGTAGKIIENFMILYNYCQALYLNYTIGTAINRIHETPDILKIQEAREELKDLGYEIPPINTLDITYYLQKVLDTYKDTKDYKIISKTFLKSMPRAYYSPYQLGHFGLGLDYYSHSTSPIRRYPDLKAQQIIDSYHQGKFNEIESTDELNSICDHCSYKERQADLLEKQANLIKMMDYVDRHPEKTYYGIVSNVRPERFEFETMTGIPGYVEYEPNDSIVYSKNKKQLKNKNGLCLLKCGDLVQIESNGSNRRELKMKANFLKNLTLQEQNMKGATALKKTYVKK